MDLEGVQRVAVAAHLLQLPVDLLDVGPLKESLWGFNGFFSKKNGGGFLTDHFHPLFLQRVSVPDLYYFPKGYLPLFSGFCHPSVVTERRDASPPAFWAASP